MLKNRSKSFVPKFKGGPRRPPANPASTQSSARPSVERQSQTPAPEPTAQKPLPTEESALSAPENNAVRAPDEVSALTAESIPQPGSSHHPIEVDGPSTAPGVSVPEPNISNLKRKSTDDPAPEPAPKRVTRPPPSLETENESTTIRPKVPPTTEPLTLPHSTISAPTTAQPAIDDPKRKAREDEVTGPPAKRRATQLQEAAGTNNIIRNTGNYALVDAILPMGNALPVANTPLTNNDPEIQISQSVEAAVNETGPTSHVQANAPAENDSISRAVTEDNSRGTSPESIQDAPQFRYPTPDNAQVMSSIRLPSLSNAGAETPGLGAAGDIDSTLKSGPAARVSQIVPLAGLNADGSAAPHVEELATGTDKGKKKKKVVRRKKVQAAEEGDDARATVDMQLNRPRRVAGEKRSRKKKDGDKKKRRRAMTPEGAEDEVIDTSTTTLTDLCKDLKIGKKFSKHAQIKERLLQKKLQAKLEKEHPELLNREKEDNGEKGSPGPGEGPSVVAPGGGIQMRVVGGQLVLDESTLHVDRGERVRRAQENDEGIEIVEEDDFTKLSTSGSYMKRVRPMAWDHTETNHFYDLLRQWGTDFETIAKAFPQRNRRQIKLKFNKEERDAPDRVTRALTGKKEPINMDEFIEHSGIKLEDVEDIEAEREKINQEHKEEDERHFAAIAEADRKKKETIRASGKARSDAARRILDTVDSGDETPGTGSAKENRNARNREASAAPKSKKASQRKGKKNMHSSNGGGEEYEILSIE